MCCTNIIAPGLCLLSIIFGGWGYSEIKVIFFSLTWLLNKAPARSYLSPCGHREDSKRRRLAARHLSVTLSKNWSSLMDLAVEDCVLNCLEKGGSRVPMNAVNIWITVWKFCLKMMAADLRKSSLDLSGCCFVRAHFMKPSRLSFIIHKAAFHHIRLHQFCPLAGWFRTAFHCCSTRISCSVKTSN